MAAEEAGVVIGQRLILERMHARWWQRIFQVVVAEVVHTGIVRREALAALLEVVRVVEQLEAALALHAYLALEDRIGCACELIPLLKLHVAVPVLLVIVPHALEVICGSHAADNRAAIADRIIPILAVALALLILLVHPEAVEAVELDVRSDFGVALAV